MKSTLFAAISDWIRYLIGFPRLLPLFLVWVVASLLFLFAARRFPLQTRLPGDVSIFGLAGILCSIVAFYYLVLACTSAFLARRGQPEAESKMLGRVYRLVAGLCSILAIAYAMGKLGSFGAFFTLFGGMLLGWSLQAPISGFAAWVLVSITRPFRPQDRVKFPALNLKGDVLSVGLLYTELEQIGGAIGSDEGEGRRVLIPNAMLFSQVVVNYTVLQNAAYVLDEIILRITYESDWDAAERIMLNAAKDITADVIRFTGADPYIRSETYDYGVYLKLRYRTPVKERAEIAYRISKRIYQEIRSVPNVDLAIPFVYSYRAGLDRKHAEAVGADSGIQEIPIDQIRSANPPVDPDDVVQIAQSIAENGLLQPIIVSPAKEPGFYNLVLGDLRLAACRQLDRKTIPAIVKKPDPASTATP